jgi:hypothetical protein
VDFVALVVAIDGALQKAKLPFAFGGALALGMVATPRGTVDIDINVFVGPHEIGRVAEALRTLGYEPPTEDSPPIAGLRFTHAEIPLPIDVFPSLDERYDEVERRVTRHAFGPQNKPLPFLSAEDICLFKLSFGRDKDWLDLQDICENNPTLDVAYVERQLIALRGPTMYARLARFRAFLP